MSSQACTFLGNCKCDDCVATRAVLGPTNKAQPIPTRLGRRVSGKWDDRDKGTAQKEAEKAKQAALSTNSNDSENKAPASAADSSPTQEKNADTTTNTTTNTVTNDKTEAETAAKDDTGAKPAVAAASTQPESFTTPLSPASKAEVSKSGYLKQQRTTRGCFGKKVGYEKQWVQLSGSGMPPCNDILL